MHFQTRVKKKVIILRVIAAAALCKSVKQLLHFLTPTLFLPRLKCVLKTGLNGRI